MAPLEKFYDFEFCGEIYLGELDELAEAEENVRVTQFFEEAYFGVPREEILAELGIVEEPEEEEQQPPPIGP